MILISYVSVEGGQNFSAQTWRGVADFERADGEGGGKISVQRIPMPPGSRK